MKRLTISIFAFLFSTALLAQTSGSIKLKITGVKNNKGIVQIGLYNNADKFPKEKEYFKGIKIKAEGKNIEYTFKDIPAGTYAIAVFHDINEDSKLNKNFLGVPKEKYGFSLNKFGTLGPPSYKDLSFNVEKEQEIVLTIDLE